MSRKCATCWRGTGTSESNRICRKCENREANRDWVNTPSQEIYGLDVEQLDLDRAVPDSEPGPYETPLCIEIMRRYCIGESRRHIASELKTGEGHVSRTVEYWCNERPHFLSEVIKMIRRRN